VRHRAVVLPELFSTSVARAIRGPDGVAFILAVLASLGVAINGSAGLVALCSRPAIIMPSSLDFKKIKGLATAVGTFR